MTYDFVPVAAITIICYFIAELVKKTPLDNKWIPTICGALGAILAIGAFQFGWGVIPADDFLTAIAIGITSGFAATGINQLGKQLTHKEGVDTDEAN